MGFQGCTDLYRAGHFVLDQEVLHALIPKMTQEASAVVLNGAEAVASEISRYLKKPSGLGDSIQFLDTIGKLLETSEKANRDKLERAQQRNKELRQAKAGAEKLYHWLQKKLWLFRWLHFFIKARFRRVYPRCVRTLIRNELEVAARKLLDKRVFPGMHRALASQQERLNLVRDAVQGLHDAVCGCKRCPLGETRIKFVFGDGDANAGIMFIGEAPGADEDKQGIPFVGRAGKLLTRMIESLKLTRDEVYIGNILKCRPPGNRDPRPDEIVKCEPIFIKQIELIKPKVIFALGRISGQTLLKTNEPLKAMRGQIHDYHGVKLIVSYHPAALLRNPNWKPAAWEDLKFLRREFDGLEL